MRAIIPSAVTLMGAFAALLSMLWAPVHGYWACNAIIAASLFDMIDGRVARLLDAQSAIGKELDSLVDVIAFGVAPAYLAYSHSLHELDDVAGLPLAVLPLFAFVGASALRLAIFNSADDPSSSTFRGIPTPVAALLVTCAVMIDHENGLELAAQPGLSSALLVGAGLFMVAPIDFPSYKSFRSKLWMILYFGAMAGGVTMLLVGLPGGTVLFAFMVIYLLRGLVQAVASGATSSPSAPKSSSTGN